MVLRGSRQEWVPLRRHGGLGVSGGVNSRPPFGTIFKGIGDRWDFSTYDHSYLMFTLLGRLALEACGFVPVALAGHLGRCGIDLTLSQLHSPSADDARR